MSDHPTISISDVERELQRDIRLRPVEGGLEAVRRNAEKARILEAIEQAGGNRSLAARLLGLSRRTFYNKLDQLEISSLPPPSNAPR
jgi:two-component system response regulator AtoC